MEMIIYHFQQFIIRTNVILKECADVLNTESETTYKTRCLLIAFFSLLLKGKQPLRHHRFMKEDHKIKSPNPQTF